MGKKIEKRNKILIAWQGGQHRVVSNCSQFKFLLLKIYILKCLLYYYMVMILFFHLLG
jgi:hypothetical protein